jgi:hypothetical protein
MRKQSKQSDGKYHIKGKKFSNLVGTRARVFHGTAYKTSGGLTKKDLLKNKSGRIVSEAKYKLAKQQKHLFKAGYTAKKGRFGCYKIKTKKFCKMPWDKKSASPAKAARRRSSRVANKSAVGTRKSARLAKRGGMLPLSPADVMADGIDGAGITNYDSMGADGLQFEAGQAGGKPRRRRTARRHRGGMSALSPADVMADGIDGAGITNYDSMGADGLQFEAGQAGGKPRRRKSRKH